MQQVVRCNTAIVCCVVLCCVVLCCVVLCCVVLCCVVLCCVVLCCVVLCCVVLCCVVLCCVVNTSCYFVLTLWTMINLTDTYVQTTSSFSTMHLYHFNLRFGLWLVIFIAKYDLTLPFFAKSVSCG